MYNHPMRHHRLPLLLVFTFTAALADPFDVNALHSIERVAGRRVTAVGAPRSRIGTAVETYAGEVRSRAFPTREQTYRPKA